MVIHTLVSRERVRESIKSIPATPRLFLLPLLASILCSCAPQSTVTQQGTRPVALRASPAAFIANADPVQAALRRVHAHPLYQQAESACREKRFGAAATLLARLAALPDLDADAKAFVQQQRSVCLHDAGLPAPVVTFPRLSSSPAPPTRTPADADCGPRALELVCQQIHVSASVPQLRQWAGTTSEGTSMAGLAAAAKRLGLKAEGVQVSREALPEQEMPAIAWVNKHHFIAVLALKGSGENGTVRIHDPNSASEETISQERLLRLCSGYLLLLRR